jgi:hypothetical protein
MATHLRLKPLQKVIASGMPARVLVTACDENGKKKKRIDAYDCGIKKLR